VKGLGKVACWVDDNTAGAVELTGTADVGDSTPTYVPFAQSVNLMLTFSLTMIDLGVPSGPHYVECSLMGKEGETTAPFKMLGM
jgi:hypothetical protein